MLLPISKKKPTSRKGLWALFVLLAINLKSFRLSAVHTILLLKFIQQIAGLANGQVLLLQPEPLGIPKLLRLNALNNSLGLLDNFVQLLIAPDIQRPEPFEKVGEIGHHRIAKDFGPAIFLTAQTFGQMVDQLGKFLDKSLLGQFDGFLKTSLHTLGFLPVKLWTQLPQIGRRFNGREIVLYRK